MFLSQRQFVALHLVILLGVAAGCGNSQRVQITMAYSLGTEVVQRHSVPVVSSDQAESGWPAGQFPSLEVTWNRAPEIQFHEVWIGFDSNDFNEREHLGYEHTNTDYIRHATTNTNQKYMTINLQDIPSKRRREIRHVTLVFRLERLREMHDLAVNFAFTPEAKSSALNARSWFLSTFPIDVVRNGTQAIEDGLEACQLTDRKDANSLDTLAAAYAETGDFKLAIESEAAALALLKDAAGPEATSFNERLRLYQQNKTYREWPPLPK